MTTAAYHREWRKNNPESFKKSQEKYRLSVHGRRAMKDRLLKKNFGITIQEYDAMLVAQNHCCAICGLHQSEMVKNFDVDHNHLTGNIRGLLCNPCNQALGLLGDSLECLEKAMAYLRKDAHGDA